MVVCPLCRTPMNAVKISGVEIDFCRQGCKGLWFDNYELIKLDEVHEGSGDELQEILSAQLVDDTRSHKLTCPRCDIPLKRRKYRAGSDVEIDTCYGCNGIFLDSGELAVIRANYEEIQKKSAEYMNHVGDKLAAHATPQTPDRGVGILSSLFGRRR